LLAADNRPLLARICHLPDPTGNCITVDAAVKKPGYAVKAGETVAGKIDPPAAVKLPSGKYFP
jgi:hypothetical protein